jgi:hypothetical protein
MGLFSSSTKIYVSSTAYNMAGEESSRIEYLKSTVARSVLTNVPSISDSIIGAQMNGPIMSQKTFFRWSNHNYPQGQVTGSATNRQLITDDHDETLKNFVVSPGEDEVEISLAFIDNAEISFFAERHFLENNYTAYLSDWHSDYHQATNRMKIIYEDGSEEFIDVPDFKAQSDYLYVYYDTVSEIDWLNVVTEDMVYNQTSEPNVTGWDENHYATSSSLSTLTTTVTTVDHTTDPDTESNSSSTRNETAHSSYGIYARIVDMGYTDETQREELKERQQITFRKKFRIVIVETVDNSDPDQTVTTREEQIENYWESQLLKQEGKQYAGRKDDMLIYEMGSGNASLDALQQSSAVVPEFYPFIPLRYDNRYINEPPYEVDFPKHDDAYKRATGGDIRDLLASIDDNPSVGDIDHAYVTFGVELNTEEKEGRRYIYEFMKGLIQYQDNSSAEDVGWAENNEYFIYYNDYLEWSTDQADAGSPRYGEPEPTAVVFPVPRISKLALKSTYEDTLIKYDVSIEWVFITENFGVGKGKVGAAVNEFWWESQDTTYNTPGSLAAFSAAQLKIEALGLTHSRLYWQVSDDVFSYLDLFGMTHINRIYKGKSVQISTKEALEDTDVSGFVVPMHYPTIKKIPLPWANELASSSQIIIFNSYLTVTTKWYQKSIFKIIFAIILAVVIALVFPPAAGLLGTNAYVGAQMGFTAGSTAAIVAGATANAIAAIVLTQVISTVSVELFGEKWGRIIAAIVTVMVGNMASSYHQTGSFAMDWGKFMRVDNLIAMTDSVATGVQGYAANEVSDIQEDMAEAKEEYEDDVQSIIERMENLGYSGVELDPLIYIQQDNLDDRNVTSEPSEIFLRRTLLTGSDIAEMTHALIDEFVEISLKLPEANG